MNSHSVTSDIACPPRVTFEQIRYLDGVLMRMRPVRADDRERFRQGFENLSIETRYCRCFNHRKSLTEGELNMLCNVDGTLQDVLVVLSLDENGNENESIAGARLIRASVASTSAEMAFLVTDAWQRRHVGLWLLACLVERARRQGIYELRCYLLPENFKARRLLAKVSEHTNCRITIDEEGSLLDLQNCNIGADVA